MSLPFDLWKLHLLESAGDASPPVRQLGDYVLELFWRDGCEPTMTAMLDYAQGGLCDRYDIRASEAETLAADRHRKPAERRLSCG
jgi:hypothetical protein